MPVPAQTRYKEWQVVTEATASNIPTVIRTEEEKDPASQTFGTEDIGGSRWVFDSVVHDGTNFQLFFWRYNYKV